jgi:hypothetical protein
MSTTEQLEYPYKANAWMMLLGTAFFGACTAGMASAALSNDRGLILNGIIEFTPDGATRFYGAIAIVSALFVIAALLMLVLSFVSPGSVRLTAEELCAPAGNFGRKPTKIPLDAIVDIGVHTVQRQRFMNVYHHGGKLSLAQSMLPNAEAFEKLHAALAASLRRRRGPTTT